jgi:predicted TIM-barrel fold metal-dependent hydrolase
MIIDCHFHLDPEMMDISQIIQRMDQSKIDKVALIASLIDPLPDPPKFLIPCLIWLLKRNMFRPLGRILCSNFTKQGDIQILSKTYSIYQKPDNDPIFNAIDQYPERFLGWAFINPNSDQDIVLETNRWIDHPNCIGIKTHPFWHQYRPVELIPAAKIAAKKGKPILIHLGFDEHGDYLSLLEAIPELKLIIAHAGFPKYSDQWDIIRTLPNVFVDLSQTIYVDMQTIKEVVRCLGPEKCLFGTDGPYGSKNKDGLFDFDIISQQISQLFPEPDVQECIMGNNFKQFL